MRTILLVAVVCVVSVHPGLVPVGGAADPEHRDAAEGSTRARILGALDLPLRAQALRRAGAEEKQVKAGLRAIHDRRLPAVDAAGLLDAAARSARIDGPVGNFGEFVKARLEEGLRGEELAAAIRQEHALRGDSRGARQGDGSSEAASAGARNR